jgi:hypothetical protein
MGIGERAGAEARALSTRLELAAMTCRLLTESWVLHRDFSFQGN